MAIHGVNRERLLCLELGPETRLTEILIKVDVSVLSSLYVPMISSINTSMTQIN